MFKHISNTKKYVATGVVAGALAFGAYAIGNSNSNSGNGSNGTATAAQAGPTGAPRPGFGAPVTGVVAAKVKAAVLAKYSGTVGRIIKLPDGSYVAQVTTSNGELHVGVSKNYKVTGARQGGPGAGGPAAGGPGGGAIPGGQSSAG